jgi:protein gp37
MADQTKIEWTTSTFNPWIGCTNVSPGCDHCYAETQNEFRKWTQWGPHGERRRTSSANWQKPLQWQRGADAFYKQWGHRQRVFCASLADVFDNQAPQGWRDDLWKLIRDTPDLDWQLLTKRPQNIRKMLPSDWGKGYRNVWLGISAEDQEHWNQRWPVLADIPAKIRFLSYEPALGPLDLAHPAREFFHAGMRVDWVISGGESGNGARLMQPAWARAMRDQCRDLGIPFFHKQWGTYQSNPLVIEGGKRVWEAARLDPLAKGGCLLDGQRHREFPN